MTTHLPRLLCSIGLCLAACGVAIWAQPIWLGIALLLAALAVVVSPPD